MSETNHWRRIKSAAASAGARRFPLLSYFFVALSRSFFLSFFLTCPVTVAAAAGCSGHSAPRRVQQQGGTSTIAQGSVRCQCMILLNAIAASDSQWCEHSLTHSFILLPHSLYSLCSYQAIAIAHSASFISSSPVSLTRHSLPACLPLPARVRRRERRRHFNSFTS